MPELTEKCSIQKVLKKRKKLANKTYGNSNKSLKKVRVIVRVRCYVRVTLRGQAMDHSLWL